MPCGAEVCRERVCERVEAVRAGMRCEVKAAARGKGRGLLRFIDNAVAAKQKIARHAWR